MLFFSSRACHTSQLLHSRWFEFESRNTEFINFTLTIIRPLLPSKAQISSSVPCSRTHSAYVLFFGVTDHGKLYPLIFTSVNAKLDSGLNDCKHSLNVIFQANLICWYQTQLFWNFLHLAIYMFWFSPTFYSWSRDVCLIFWVPPPRQAVLGPISTIYLLFLIVLMFFSQ